MKHRGLRKERIGDPSRKQRLPEHLATKWPWGPDPIKTVLFFLLAPALLVAGAFGGMGWSWWQRLLAGMGGFALIAYLLLMLFGVWRSSRNREPQQHERP